MKTLNNQVQMPEIALGVWKSHEDTEQAVLNALSAGYRHIDTAACYKNEEDVGRAILKSAIPREELFITTKLWNDDIRAGRTREAFEESLKKLGLDYVDLYLIHWPVQGHEAAYKEMMQLRNEGKIRAIGVSNYKKHHLEELIAAVNEIPAVDQIEFNPQMQDEEVFQFCKNHGIVLEAWSPLGHGQSLQLPEIAQLAEKYQKSPAQIILRWLNQKGIVILPKSVHEKRIRENIDLFDFTLSPEDTAYIDGLNQNLRTGPDPDNFDF